MYVCMYIILLYRSFVLCLANNISPGCPNSSIHIGPSEQPCMSGHLLSFLSNSSAVGTYPKSSSWPSYGVHISKDAPRISLWPRTIRGKSCRYGNGVMPDTFRLLGIFFTLVHLASPPSSGASSSESPAFLLR